jgi:SPP1 family predicted phage head-tail adaptor
MKMLAPRLRHRIDVQEFTTTQDSETGAVVEEWVSILDSNEELMPAEIMPMSGKEYVAAASIQANVNTKITVRWRSDIQPAMRVVHDGTIYNVRAVLPDPTLRRHITLMCSSGVNDG